MSSPDALGMWGMMVVWGTCERWVAEKAEKLCELEHLDEVTRCL
jgi:hypothetical protein